MARTTYRKDDETGEWITKAEWHAKYGPDDVIRGNRGQGSGPAIMSDIDPYISTIDGSVIGSRSTHRAHLKQHGREEIGTESMEEAQKFFVKPESNKKEVKQAVVDAYNKLEQKIA